MCGREKAVACLFTRRLTACVNMRWAREKDLNRETERERDRERERQ